ncbi:hypothetical protein GQX73_g7023 [Xylaria multiplex]|uniref:Uncharacterized protein n=1 Tax=Xylaria multiplex TaxID=323545 RepID=A0A7C8ILD4_9PEZI|nr:hypothetical protein GQX73_g7023 [Xylaria multiplex]
MNGIKDLVKHAIEQEHGYVGFKGSILEDKLPESAFGKQLLRSGKAGDVAEEITRRADGNIALAHKRLEILHHDQSLKVFYATNDRLPATIVDMFDSGVYSVETQALNERTLGLQALAIVGHNQNGVSFEKFKKLTQLSAKARGIGRKYNPCRSIDDVLHAAKGLVIRETDQDRLLLKAFHSDFFFYCREHYRPSIVWANSLLQETEYDLGPLKRAQTFSPRGIKDSGTNSTSQVKGVANSWKKRKESILPNLPRLEEMEEGDDKVANRSFSFHRSGTFHGL